jgi:hypothetical protein
MNKPTEKRVTRKPLHQRGPHTISGEKDPNFHYRFVLDSGSRIHQMQEAGYEIVTDNDMVVGDSRVSDTTQQGSGKRVVSKNGDVAYLMKQKKDWYAEDQAAKQKQNDELEQSMTQEASKGMYGSIKTSRS